MNGIGPLPRSLSPIEVLVLLGLSVFGHTALAVQVARARTAGPGPVTQTVAIEIERPPIEPPKVPPPPVAEPARPPVARRATARPTVRPQLEPPAPSEQPPATDEPPPLPVGEDGPSAESGNGAAGAPALPPAPVAVVKPPAPVIAAREGANYLKNPRPAYPEAALRRGWQGEVLLRVRVTPEGKAAGITVQRSSGRDALDEAAVAAVRGWTFVPARQGGAAVGGWVTVPIVFKLQEGE